MHLGHEHVICCWEVDGVLIDPGPQSCEETLLAAIGGERPKALLLTHIHFDHAGAAGALVRRWPDLPVYVHERGAKHLVDPERLVASAARLYGGEDGLARLWGEVVPVPEENLRVLEGGETGIEGAFRVEYTPGHASHHVCYFHEERRLGVRRRHGRRRRPAQPLHARPDAAARHRRRGVGALARRHRGLGAPSARAHALRRSVDDPPEQLERVRATLREQARLAGEHDQEGFVEAYTRYVREQAGDGADAILQAAPLDQLWLGLDRWRSKSGPGILKRR